MDTLMHSFTYVVPQAKCAKKYLYNSELFDFNSFL